MALLAAPPPLLLDDFSRPAGRPAVGAGWRAFTDQVMGGVSTQSVSRETLDGERALRLQGDVRLENNGGFVQVALDLAGPLDASAFTGLRLRVRGNGERYAVHLRTRDTRLPWQYYEAGFVAGPQWTTVDLPFARFAPQALRNPLDPRTLASVGIVASKRVFRADVAVSRLELY
jgi:hypothetical protein